MNSDFSKPEASGPSTLESIPAGVAFRDPADMVPLDMARLATALRDAGLVLDEGVAPRQFAGGLANLNYLLSVDGRWRVLRRAPAGPLPPGANDMVREHRVLSRLWQALPLAPRSLFVSDDASVVGAPFQILDYCLGVAVRGDRMAPLDETPENGARLSGMLISTLARIHALDPADAGLDTLGRPEGFFERSAGGWIKRAENACGGTIPTAGREVADWLTAQKDPASSRTVLVHNDFKLDNILIDPETVEPLAVVDWDMATRGPALTDLATLLSYWTEPGDPDCMHQLAQMPTARPGFISREKAVLDYQAATGISVDSLAPFRALAVFRLAVIFHQLHNRHVSGETTDPRYASFGRLGDDLFVFARDIVRERIF